MKRIDFIRWLSLTLAMTSLTACSSNNQDPIDLLLTNARVITATGEVLNRASILIDGGLIVEIDQHNRTNRAALRTIDLNGQTVLPGFIDTHVHLLVGDGMPGSRQMPLSDEALSSYIEKTLPARLQTLLSRGFTTVQSTGDYFPAILEVKKKIATAPKLGPRILTVGPVVCTAGGHPAKTVCGGNPWCASHLAREVRTVAEVTGAVRELSEAGVDAVKVVHDSGLGSPLAPDLLKAVVQAAHDRQLRVVVHAGSVSEAVAALKAGADRLVHPPALDTIQSEELPWMLKRNGVSVASTLAISSMSDGWEESQGRARRYLVNALTNVKFLKQSGVKVAFGTDVPMLSVDETLDLELKLLQESGYSSSEIIEIMTRNAASHLGILDKVGTVESGKVADLIAVHGDPLQDLAALRAVQLVLREGQVAFEK